MAISQTGKLSYDVQRHGRWLNPDPWPMASGVVGLIAATPILVVLSSLVTPSVDVWAHLWQTQLAELVWNTLRLMVGVGLGVLVLGTGLAWLVTTYRFPGRGLLQWLLVLPLAMPTYVIGFVFRAVFDYTGPVQSWLRTIFGMDAWFPEIASYGGVTLVMTLVLYPYVYVLARLAFLEQSASTLEAARALGAKGPVVFWKVAFPLARPSIAAGMAFALMEALADFGTVAVFGYSTFTVAIYRVWFGMFNRPAATELASLLLVFTLGLYASELCGRGRSRFYQTNGAMRPTSAKRLCGWKAWTASCAVGLVVGAAFILPVTQLLVWVVSNPDVDEKYLEFLFNTLVLGLTAAFLAVAAAVVVAYGLRLSRSWFVAAFARVAAMGYAVPGSVIAVGVLSPLAFLDHNIDAFLQRTAGVSSGLLFTGSIVGLIFAYFVRFLAVGLQTIESSLVKITPSMDMAGRSLGVGAGGVLRRVHLPLLKRGLSAAGILVLVDVMKEMPATLLLRPFGYDTLAVRVWQLTSESFWEEASLPALTIVAAGILPVLWLMRARGKLASG